MTPARTPQERANRTEDEQLAAARTMLGLDAGKDIVKPLQDLLAERQRLVNALAVMRAMDEMVIRSLRKQIADIQALVEEI